MAGGSKSSSTPQDMTPAAFQQLQSPFANVLAQLMGYSPAPVQAAPASTFRGGSAVAQGSNRMGGPGTPGYVPKALQPANGPGPYAKTLADQQRMQAAQGQTQVAQGPYAPTSGQGGGLGDILRGIPQYGGPLTAALGANEQTILDQLMQISQGGGAAQGGVEGDAIAYLQKVLAGDFMPGEMDEAKLTEFMQMIEGASGPQNNDLLQQAIQAAQRPTMQGLEETLTRSLPGRFTAGGQFTQPQGSSAFDRAAAIATRGAGDAMADIATNLSYQSLEAERGRQHEAMSAELNRNFQGIEGERGRQNEAAGMASQVSQGQVDTLIKNLQAQALPRLIEEFGIERGLEQFNNRMNALLQTLGITAGVTQPTIANKEKSSTKPNIMPMFGGLGG